jgi:hypothetical protein
VANLYGVANPIYQGVIAGVIGGSNIPITAGVETNIIQFPVSAPSPGNLYIQVWLSVVISWPASTPTTTQFGLRIGAGADFDTAPINMGAVVPSSNVVYSYCMTGNISLTLYNPPGITCNLTVATTVQPCTVLAGGSRAVLNLFRGQDG